MPPLDFISSGRSVRKRLPLEKFVDYTHCCESSISFAVFSRHFKNVHSRNCSWCGVLDWLLLVAPVNPS